MFAGRKIGQDELRSLGREHLTQLHKTIRARKQLKNMFQEKKLLDMGLYEQASQLQKPTTEAIQAVQTEIQKQTPTPQPLSVASKDIVEDKRLSNITPLFKEQSHSNKYVLQLTTGNITIHGNDYPIWLLGQHFFLLVDKDSVPYIINYSLRDSAPIELTQGLNEILFNNGENKSIITEQDINIWNSLMYNSNMRNYKNSRYWKSFNPTRKETKAALSPQVEEKKDYKGDGIKRGESEFLGGSKPTSLSFDKGSIILPSDPNELRQQLVLQLSAAQAGNNKTFNHTNAIMKEMLRQQLITAKDYRNILKTIYHI